MCHTSRPWTRAHGKEQAYLCARTGPPVFLAHCALREASAKRPRHFWNLSRGSTVRHCLLKEHGFNHPAALPNSYWTAPFLKSHKGLLYLFNQSVLLLIPSWLFQKSGSTTCSFKMHMKAEGVWKTNNFSRKMTYFSDWCSKPKSDESIFSAMDHILLDWCHEGRKEVSH